MIAFVDKDLDLALSYYIRPMKSKNLFSASYFLLLVNFCLPFATATSLNPGDQTRQIDLGLSPILISEKVIKIGSIESICFEKENSHVKKFQVPNIIDNLAEKKTALIYTLCDCNKLKLPQNQKIHLKNATLWMVKNDSILSNEFKKIVEREIIKKQEGAKRRMCPNQLKFLINNLILKNSWISILKQSYLTVERPDIVITKYDEAKGLLLLKSCSVCPKSNSLPYKISHYFQPIRCIENIKKQISQSKIFCNIKPLLKKNNYQKILNKLERTNPCFKVQFIDSYPSHFTLKDIQEMIAKNYGFNKMYLSLYILFKAMKTNEWREVQAVHNKFTTKLSKLPKPYKKNEFRIRYEILYYPELLHCLS